MNTKVSYKVNLHYERNIWLKPKNKKMREYRAKITSKYIKLGKRPMIYSMIYSMFHVNLNSLKYTIGLQKI